MRGSATKKAGARRPAPDAPITTEDMPAWMRAYAAGRGFGWYDPTLADTRRFSRNRIGKRLEDLGVGELCELLQAIWGINARLKRDCEANGLSTGERPPCRKGTWPYVRKCECTPEPVWDKWDGWMFATEGDADHVAETISWAARNQARRECERPAA